MGHNDHIALKALGLKEALPGVLLLAEVTLTLNAHLPKGRRLTSHSGDAKPEPSEF